MDGLFASFTRGGLVACLDVGTDCVLVYLYIHFIWKTFVSQFLLTNDVRYLHYFLDILRNTKAVLNIHFTDRR